CPNRGGSRNGPPWHAPRRPDGLRTVIVGGVKDEPSVSGKSTPRAFPGSDVLLRHNGLYTSGAPRAPHARGAVVKHSRRSDSRRIIDDWATARSSSSAETTSVSAPGQTSGPASRTNFANTFFASRTKGTASASTTKRR